MTSRITSTEFDELAGRIAALEALLSQAIDMLSETSVERFTNGLETRMRYSPVRSTLQPYLDPWQHMLLQALELRPGWSPLPEARDAGDAPGA